MNQQRINALKEAWKQRKNYLGPDKNTSLYTTWRARVFTAKGKKAGFPQSWATFQGFKKETLQGWEEGKVLVRRNPKKPFSKDNCEWLDKGTETIYRLAKIEYKGVSKTLVEWCQEYDLNYNGVRQRYHKGKNYTSKQILFGKPRREAPFVKDYLSLDAQAKKTKISKMLSAYKLKDKKKNYEFNLTKEFLEKNIILKPCIYCGATENVGCDRINNKKGHTTDNVVPACYICNHVRNNHFTIEEMKLIGQTIKKIKKQREK